MPCIGVTDNTFLEGWESILKEAELTLMHVLKEKNNTIYFELHNDFFFKKINESIDNDIDINIVRDLVQHFIDMKNQLFNRRTAKLI